MDEKVLKALIKVYKETEHGQLPPPDFCAGHDKAVLHMAEELGMTQTEFYDEVDKEQ